jgi:hypothetical protein
VNSVVGWFATAPAIVGPTAKATVGDLECRAVTARTAVLCRAEQVALGIGDQAAGGIGTRVGFRCCP